ncbi:MAG TPA: protein rep, partial [Gemmatimonadaceae bacterium]|nr:protein rep [Gemmatimonadaceae bacterium]
MTGARISGDERAFTEERGARREAPRAPECERSRALEFAPATRSEESPPAGGVLDTLAQLGQRSSQRAPSEARPARSEILLKRARAKYFSTPLAINLAKLRSPLEKSYRNTVYCSATLSQEDGKIVGSYCGNRWCMVCNRIRTARAIHRYMPIVESWPDKYLVTLTLKNVPAAELPKRLDLMVKAFQATKLAMRRTDGIKLVALRKLECTHNARTDEYHPHFHVVVAGTDSARLLVLR